MPTPAQVANRMEGNWRASNQELGEIELSAMNDGELWGLNLDGSSWMDCRGALSDNLSDNVSDQGGSFSVTMQFDFMNVVKGTVSPDYSTIAWENGTTWRKID